MKKVELTLTFGEEELEALEFCLKKEKTSVRKQMDEALRQLYESKVPEPVREYLEAKAVPPARTKRPPRSDPSKPERPKAPVPQEEAQP